MPNIKQTLDGHNKGILSKSVKPNTTAITCNCRKANECPLSKKCSTESVVYQATVTSTSADSPQTYIGLTENSFKTRYTNHKASFKKYDKRNATELSKYIWHLQANNINYNVKWRILIRACYPIKRVKLFAFSKCQTNKDGHNTEMKEQN